MQEQDEYLTEKEATEYLKISRATLANYAKRGLIRKYAQIVPRKVYYKKSELDGLKQIKPKE